MIIFLYGPDNYRLKENVDTIVSSHQKKHQSGLNLYRFDFSSDRNFDDLANAVKSNSFFKETKLVIIKNIFCRKDHSDSLRVIIEELGLGNDKDIVLVFVEDQRPKELEKINKSMFSFLCLPKNLVRNIEYLNEPKLSAWVRSKFKENGQDVSLGTARLLADMVGNESWALANEIVKLSNYKSGGIATEQDIHLLINHKENGNIFNLVDEVGNQNKAKAFETIYRLINSGHDGYYLLSMLFYHFENLLSVHDLLEKNNQASAQLVAAKCGLHPFVAKKAVNQAGKFRKEDLLSKLNHLAGLDIVSKNGSINLEDSLYSFTLNQ